MATTYNIQKLNLTDLNARMESYQKNVAEMKKYISDIHNTMFQDLSKVWTGAKMNALIKKWNTLKTSYVKYINYYYTAGCILDKITRQYVAVENDRACTAKTWTTLALADVKKTSANLTFDATEVSKIINKMRHNVGLFRSTIGNLYQDVEIIKDYSDSLTKFYENWLKNSEKICTDVDSLNKVLEIEISNNYNEVWESEKTNSSTAEQL